MPSLSIVLTTVLALTSSISPLPVQAAPSTAVHPHGFHAPPYLASSVANTVKRGFNHVTRNLAGKAKEARDLASRSASYYGDAAGFSKPSVIMKRRDTEIPTGWSYVGCVTESNDQRLLAGFAYASETAMSPLTCLTVCQGFGYQLAGMEYGDECYCAKGLTGNGGVVESDATCNMPCSGDSSANCGTAWYLSLYSYSAAASSACATTTSNLTTSYKSGILLSTSGDTYNNPLNVDGAVRASVGSGSSATSTSKSTTGTATATSTGSKPTVTVALNSTTSSEWYSLGCAVDDSWMNPRILDYTINLDDTSITIDECLAECETAGYKYAGLENGNQCFCDNSIPAATQYVSDAQCDSACTGDSTEMCGGQYRIDVYQLFAVEECSASTTTTVGVPTGLSNNWVVTGSVSKSVASATSTATAAGSVATSSIPSSPLAHAVYAHHMVGNTYSYSESNWANDISLAQGAGIDGFALNMGSDSWQPYRVTDAYTAAAAAGFKLFISLDMSSLSCGSQSDMYNLVTIVSAHSTSSAQATYNGKVMVSTFSGENCYFGQSSVSAGWQSFVTAVNNAGISMFFIPSIFSDISTFSSNSWMDGELNWNGGWPTGGSDLTTSGDQEYINALNGKTYMGAISPGFYTHFGPATYNKNWLYRGDDWLYIQRWEQMISMRDQIKLVEILTWNDYGESSYIGPIDGDLPITSSNWVNGFPHTALLPITNYYATAFKTGSYPSITTDSITMWARPHPYNANAWGDSVGQPANWQDTQDYVWVLVMATASGSVSITSGSTTSTFSVVAGPNSIKVASQAGSMSGTFTRNGATMASVDAGSNYSFNTSPQLYNFNYYVISSTGA